MTILVFKFGYIEHVWDSDNVFDIPVIRLRPF